MKAVLYRLRQGMRALFAFAFAVDESLAAHYLSPTLLASFCAMRRSERQHSLRVLRALLRAGDVSSTLAVAALLHDVGKSCYPIALWQRSLPVLVRAIAPPLFDRLAQGSPENPWMRGFVVYTHHPRWSAEIIARCGGAEDAAWLAEHHADDIRQWHTHPLYADLLRLKYADDHE